MPHAKFEIYDDKSDHYRWRLVSSNGQETATAAHHFASKEDAKRACEELKEHVAGAEIVEVQA
jgi:uncharacterized protein YegP (UPF0339 family)